MRYNTGQSDKIPSVNMFYSRKHKITTNKLMILVCTLGFFSGPLAIDTYAMGDDVPRTDINGDGSFELQIQKVEESKTVLIERFNAVKSKLTNILEATIESISKIDVKNGICGLSEKTANSELFIARTRVKYCKRWIESSYRKIDIGMLQAELSMVASSVFDATLYDDDKQVHPTGGDGWLMDSRKHKKLAELLASETRKNIEKYASEEGVSTGAYSALSQIKNELDAIDNEIELRQAMARAWWDDDNRMNLRQCGVRTSYCPCSQKRPPR